MQEIILTCDLCKVEERKAKARSRKPPYAVATLDVCAAHHRKYGPRSHKHRTGRPRTRGKALPGESAAERRRRLDRERKKTERVNAKKHRGPDREKRERPLIAPWEARQATILAELPAVGSIGSVELQKRVFGTGKMPNRGAYVVTMKMLRKKGLVTMKGGRSRASYARATPAERATA